MEIPLHFFPERAKDWTDLVLDVTVVPYCPLAAKVSVMPIVAADYDIIRQQIHWLEQGGLLSQVSVIALHQVLHISVNCSNNAKTIQLRVQDLHTPFPSPCCRLIDTSELIVLTPPSSTESTSDEYDGLLLKRIPCRQDVMDSVEMAILAQCLEEDDDDSTASSRWIHLPQKTVAIHRQRNDDDDENYNGGGPPRIAMLRRHDRTTFIRVLGSAQVPNGCIGTLFPFEFLLLV
jgi:hypothetical protein